jgi:hypothetical protein
MANPKRPRPRAPDVNQNAFRVMREATAGHDPEDAQPDPEPEPDPAPERNPYAVALGRKGGLKGGKARAEKMTPEERSASARRAAAARWEKREPKQ